MANMYTQDIVLDADGKPVLDALQIIQRFITDIQKTVSAIGVTTVEDAKAWQQQLSLNLKSLKQAESDLRTLQRGSLETARELTAAQKEAAIAAKQSAGRAFSDPAAARAAKAESDQRLASLRAERVAQASINVDGAREIAIRIEAEKAYNRELRSTIQQLERKKTATLEELSAAKLEMSRASARAGIQSITNPADAAALRQIRAANLDALRAEREQIALTDAAASKALGKQISMERGLVEELDKVIGRLERKRELDMLLGARQLNAAQFEAAGATMVSQAQSINSMEYALQEKQASDARLAAYRAEREAVALTDGEAAKWLGQLIELEKRYNAAIDQTTARIQRRMEAERLAAETQLANQKKLEDALAAEQFRARLSNDTASAVSAIRTMGTTGETSVLRELEAEHAIRLRNMRQEREQAAQNSVEASRELEKRILAEEAIGKALRQRVRELESENKAQESAARIARDRLEGTRLASEKLLVGPAVRDRVAETGSAQAALATFQQEKLAAEGALQALFRSGEENAKLLAQANQRVQLARANVSEAEKLVRLETQGKEEARANAEIHRGAVLMAQSYAAEQIKSFGAAEALRRAKVATLEAENQIKSAGEGVTRQMREQLELAKARQQATEKQTQKSPLASILSPEYGAAAFARTTVYGAAAAAAFTAMSTVGDSVRGVIQMEDELQKLQAIANATTPQMQQLKAAIYEVGTGSRFSTLDLAKISQTLAQTGVSASQMKDVLQSVTTLANASGSTPDEAVNLVTSALGAFQLQASESARVADLMTSALNRTKLTVAQTGQAIQYVGATAYEQNVSLETLLATVGAVAQAGVKSGSTIGTGFRQFLVDLQTPSQKLTDQLKALNLTTADVDVSTRGLSAVLDTLKNAGFGSAQAYGALETRAAAFYLTAKNNTDVIDELMLSFADQSAAAAAANERAMNSLTAQWQRFKNLLTAMASESVEPMLNFFKNLLTGINGYIEKYREANEKIAELREQSKAGFWNYDIGKDMEKGLQNILDGKYSPFQWVKDAKIGTALADMTKSADEAAGASGRLATKIADTGDKISQQSDLVGELEKEYRRLLQQKDTLIGNDTRSAAEMSNLMQRFQGLSGYLTNTKNNYIDLTNAVRGFIAANQEALAGSIAAQRSNIAQQNEELRSARGGLAQRVRDNPGFGKLTAAEQAAVGTVYRAGANTEEFRRAVLVLADAARRLSSDKSGIGKALNDLAQNMQKAQSNVSQERTLRPQQAAAESARRNPDIVTKTQNVEALLASAASDPKKYGAVENAITNLRTAVAQGKAKNDPRDRKYFDDLTKEIGSYTAQLKALKTPTRAEAKAAETAQRKAEREADRQAKLVTQADVDRLGTAMGLALGSGTRTKAEQNALHARGVTPATGDTSKHSNGGFARDFSVKGLSDQEAELKAATMRAQAKQMWSDSYVAYERGGPNDGTGRHIHVGVRKGTTRKADQIEANLDKVRASQAQSEIQLDQTDLSQKMAAISEQTTQETLNAAIESARTALNKLNDELLPAAQKELAAQGIAEGTAEYSVKIAQVQQQIKQNVVAFNQKVSDQLIKSVDAQIKLAERFYEEATRDAENKYRIAQAQVAGLNRYSLRGKVPDYVRALAQDRADKANEALMRAQGEALPGQIAIQKAAVDNYKAQGKAQGIDGTDEYKNKLAQLQAQLKDLKTKKEEFDAQMGAPIQIPTTLKEGLQQAVAAFNLAHQGADNFKTSLIMSLGEGVERFSTGISDMFSSIIDGSQTAGQAMANFARSMISWMVQIIAKALAMKVLKSIFKSIGLFDGGPAEGYYDGGEIGGITLGNPRADIGRPPPNLPIVIGIGDRSINRANGGAVENGSPTHDSVRTNLARGEWVIRKKAVDSVGSQFMARLNAHGSKALGAMGKVPQLNMVNQTKTNIYVVPPEQTKQLGPDDIRLVLSEELLYGDGKRLVQTIARESR